jgi:hypothetical protein
VWDSLLDSTGAFVAMLILFAIYRYLRHTDTGTPQDAVTASS